MYLVINIFIYPVVAGYLQLLYHLGIAAMICIRDIK